MGIVDPAVLWDRFMAKVQVQPDGCWTWTGQLNNHMYGVIKRGNKRRLAHVWAYQQVIGAIPPGMVLDHVCHSSSECEGGQGCLHRRCVNPSHLEPVTQRENAQRGRTGQATGAKNRSKTHCPSGHEIDGVRPSGERYCKTCNRLRERSRAAARRAKVAA